ncbi:MAG: methyltransferase domain-containing protein [Allobranchiibius sp.]
MDPALVHRLASGEGWGLLQALPPYDASTAMSLGTRLRGEGFAPDLVAAALTQSELRARAEVKFGAAARGMLFTRDGLEQATRGVIAERHAARFVQAGIQHVYDLGCGIGADASAIAAAGLRLSAVDTDEATAAIAATNLRAWPRAQVLHADAHQVDLPTGEDGRSCGVWVDPARRTPGVADANGRTRRLFRLEDLSPSWEDVRSWLTAAPAAGAKLSPAFPHSKVPPGMEAEWTSYNGEVLECALWAGAAVRTPGRSACILRDGHVPAHVIEQDAVDAQLRSAELNRLGPYLYEPDRAVIRAGLVGALINATDGRELSPGVGYVTGHGDVELTWARKYAITDAMPYNLKRLRALLRDRDAGPLTIKKRGVSIDVDQLRRQLRTQGSRATTIVVTRIGGAQVVLVVTAL